MAVVDRLVREARALLGADLVELASHVVLIVLLTHVFLTPRGYGRLNFVLSAVRTVGILATVGLQKATARYVTEFVETAPGQLPYLLRRSLAYLTTTVVAFVGVLVLFGSPLVRFAGLSTLAPFVLVGGVLVVAEVYSGYFAAIFQGFNRVTWTAVQGVVSGVSRLVLVVALVWIGFGVVGAVVGYLLASAAAAVVGGVVFYVRFYRRFDAADAPAAGLSKRLLGYSLPLLVSLGANALDKKVDVVLVGVFLNMTSVGYYTVAKQVSDVVSMPATAFGFTVSPAIGEQRSRERLDRAATLYQRSLQYVLLLYLPGVVGLALVAGPTVTDVFGSAYRPAVPIVQVYGGFILVNAVDKVTTDGLDYLGRAPSRATARTATGIGNFLLNLLLIPQIGVLGAAIASVVTYTIYACTNVYLIHQELAFDLRTVARTVGRVGLVALGMAVVVWLVLSTASGVLSLPEAVLAGVATWGALSIGTGVLEIRKIERALVG